MTEAPRAQSGVLPMRAASRYEHHDGMTSNTITHPHVEAVQRLYAAYGRGDVDVHDDVVARHGGHIDVASTLGAGTTVTVSLPLDTDRSQAN